MKRLLNKFSSTKGFTLIELLIVITIIAALAIAVFVALNPAGRVQDANNARRTADVDSILTAIHAYSVDNNGTTAPSLPAAGTEAIIGTGAACATLPGLCTASVATCANMASDLTPYLKSMPIDPNTTLWTAAKTGYSVIIDTNGIVTVKSCGAQGTTISSSR